MKNYIFLCIIIICLFSSSYAQVKPETDKEAEYTKVITSRADKIVATLGIEDTSKYVRVRSIIVNQYKFINTHHESKEEKLKDVKEKYNQDKSLAEAETKKIVDAAESDLQKNHRAYLKNLSAELSTEQIEKVKDGMTYGVLPLTYKVYQEMLPDLTNEQKTQILNYLTEAREHAMDAPSSHKKHAWFGKYKGKINNYLSAQGIDMKKAGLEWQARIKAEKVRNN